MDEVKSLPAPADPPEDVWATALSGAFDDLRTAEELAWLLPPAETAEVVPGADDLHDPAGLDPQEHEDDPPGDAGPDDDFFGDLVGTPDEPGSHNLPEGFAPGELASDPDPG